MIENWQVNILKSVNDDQQPIFIVFGVKRSIATVLLVVGMFQRTRYV